MRPFYSFFIRSRHYFSAGLTIGSLLLSQLMYAQTADGNTGINQANTMIRGYFDSATQLMYAIGAILAIVGAISVIRAHMRHEDLGGKIATWFGICVFLVLIPTVIKSFFGL